MSLSRIDVKFFKMAVGTDRLGRETETDIAARCPVCGDSKSHRNKKRLHLYTKNNVTNVNCFNGDCPAQNKTVFSFLRDFFPSLADQYKREKFTTTMEKLAEGEDVFQQFKKPPPESPAGGDPLDDWDHPVVTHDLTPYLKDISEVPEALEYLEGRGIPYDQSLYGKWYFGHQDLKIGEKLYKITGSVVIPLYYDGVMYGFYSRSITSKTFYTYNPDVNVGYKVWNWFNVDKSSPVYIFEGIFDAISSGLRNCVAMMGAGISQDRVDELVRPVFVFDDDRTGHLNGIKYAEKGLEVFVQPAGYAKDMNMNLEMGVDTKKLVLENIHRGISAVTRLKMKL